MSAFALRLVLCARALFYKGRYRDIHRSQQIGVTWKYGNTCNRTRSSRPASTLFLAVASRHEDAIKLRNHIWRAISFERNLSIGFEPSS